MAWRIVNALKNSTSQVNTGTNALDVLAAVEQDVDRVMKAGGA
jgi:hypothetical protein